MDVRSLQGDTVERICQRWYGSTSGTTETVLAANPQLAALGVILPVGTPVRLPERVTPAATTAVNLWD